MSLVALNARGFRNLEPLDLELGPGVHLVLGENGAGKTSLLEAIYLLATTKSFRTTRLADCCRHGETRFELGGEVEGRSRVRLGLVWQDGERQRTLNDGRSTLAEHLEALPVVAWTASDIDILIGSPAERRRFLDRGVVGRRPASLDVLTRYRRTLHEKRHLLQRGGSKVELETWNGLLAAAAAELVGRRAAYVEELERVLNEVLAACGLAVPAIELVYRPSPKGAARAEDIYQALAAAVPRERQLQQAVVGPHRDDLRILWGSREVRRVASAGERKALGLLLVTAHGEVLRRSGRPPTYLLDDADTELDRGRLAGLWKVLGQAGQLFATSARPGAWKALEAAHTWSCAAGRVTPGERL